MHSWVSYRTTVLVLVSLSSEFPVAFTWSLLPYLLVLSCSLTTSLCIDLFVGLYTIAQKYFCVCCHWEHLSVQTISTADHLLIFFIRLLCSHIYEVICINFGGVYVSVHSFILTAVYINTHSSSINNVLSLLVLSNKFYNILHCIWSVGFKYTTFFLLLEFNSVDSNEDLNSLFPYFPSLFYHLQLPSCLLFLWSWLLIYFIYVES